LYGDDGDHLVACILVGDNFAVNVEEGNEKGVKFYILLCTKTSFIIEEPFTCPWSQRFHASNTTMVGKYYQNEGWTRFAYVLLVQSQTTYIHVCHVQAIKFRMLPLDYTVQGNELIYKLFAHAKNSIRHAIASIEL
jgi:hypothetical protein